MEMRVYTERSNARRAARAAGVDPNAVISVDGGFTFPITTPADDDADVSKAERQAYGRAESHMDPKPADDLDIPDFLKRAEPTEEERAARAVQLRRELSANRTLTMPKTQTLPKAKSESAPKVDKTKELISMLLNVKGATVEALCKKTGWLPHTLRARISGLAKPKSKGGEGLKIKRERKDGVTSYRIAA